MNDAIPQGIPGGMQTGHQESTIQVRGLIIGAVALAVTVLICQVVLAWWMRGFEQEDARAKALHPGRQNLEVDQFPTPRLQKSPPTEMEQMREEELVRIANYGWVDRKAGIARIPVDRALHILAEKGLPKVAAKPPTTGAPPNTSIPPAGKRESAGMEGQPSSPSPAREADRPRPEPKGEPKP